MPPARRRARPCHRSPVAYRSTYHLRSNDYYSSRNYASRLIGSKLVFYSPLSLNLRRGDLFGGFPALRRWRPDTVPSDFKRIAPATRIYRADEEPEPGFGLTLHTVTVCDLAQRNMRCEATAVMWPQGRVFYVSGESVFVWTTRRGRDSGVFRIPLDGSAPSALKVAGAPVDQFSFLESVDGHLNVLLRAEGQGDAMWDGARGRSDMALLRVPLTSFSDGRDSAPASSYQQLPAATSRCPVVATACRTAMWDPICCTPIPAMAAGGRRTRPGRASPCSRCAGPMRRRASRAATAFSTSRKRPARA